MSFVLLSFTLDHAKEWERAYKMSDIYIDYIYNNSLGNCWEIKERDGYGELVDKQIYDSEYSAFDAFYDYEANCCPDFDGIEFFIASEEAKSADPEFARYISFVARYGYKPIYAVEYLSMHTAIHHLLTYENEQLADVAYDVLSQSDDPDYDGDFYDLYQPQFDEAINDIEIDYHCVEWDDEHNVWGYNDGSLAFDLIIVNAGHVVPRIYV